MYAPLSPQPPAPTPPPLPLLSALKRRAPCENCTPQVVQTWIPIDITTSSCSTSTTASWWTPESTPAQPITATVSAMTTIADTIEAPTETQTVTFTVQVTESATCCVRSGRWPDGRPQQHQAAWHVSLPEQVGADASYEADEAPRGERKRSDDGLPGGVEILRFDKRDQLFRNADLLYKRWDDDAAETLTVTATQIVTSTSIQWTSSMPTAGPTSPHGSSCSSGHWCASGKEGLASSLDRLCGCVVAWVTVIYGAVPNRSDDLAASVVTFFLWTLFFVVGLLRIFACRHKLAVLVNLIPVVIFSGGMTGYSATRAWTSDNVATTTHIVASHVTLMCLPLFLVEATLQLFGLLSKRAEQGRWILYVSYVLRLCNVVFFFLYIIAACILQNFLDSWMARGDNCDSNLSRNLSLLPLVADWLMLCCLVSVAVLTVVIRLRHCLAMTVVVHVLLTIFFLTLHFLWRILRDWAAQDVWNEGWQKWQPASFDARPSKHGPSSAVGQCWAVLPTGRPDWTVLTKAKTGPESAVQFYMLGISPLTMALCLLYMVNLAVYISATPGALPPRPDPSARYRMAYNKQTNRVEMVKVEDQGKGSTSAAAAAAVDAEGKPYYRLVRSSTGKWRFKEAKSASDSAVEKVKAFVFGWQ